MYYIFDDKTKMWAPSRIAAPRNIECDTEKVELQMLCIEPDAEKLSVAFTATYGKVEKIVDELKLRQIYYEAIFDMKNHVVAYNPYEKSKFSLLESPECDIPQNVLEILKNVLELFSSGVYGMRLGFAPKTLSDIENYVRNPLRSVGENEHKIENTKINYMDDRVYTLPDSAIDYEFILPKNTDEVYFYSEWFSMFKKEGRDYISEILKNDIVLMFVKKGNDIVAGMELNGSKIVQVSGNYKNWFYGSKDKYNDFCVNFRRWAGRHGLKIVDEEFERK
ncbi:hypothetical protein [Treponema zioleckii]|uniref:hypothetical protein n=1 Tax=Treponema zioleckii TaxID=331680 RepID=UPI00168BED15|nr:hypothetical protein [Treponema zioleckii]